MDKAARPRDRFGRPGFFAVALATAVVVSGHSVVGRVPPTSARIAPVSCRVWPSNGSTMDQWEESPDVLNSITPGDGDSLSVVPLVTHPPHRRTPTAEDLPGRRCAAQRKPADLPSVRHDACPTQSSKGRENALPNGLAGVRDHRARGFEALQKTTPGHRARRPLKLAPSSSGTLHIPDGFAKSKTNSEKTLRVPGRRRAKLNQAK